MRRSRLLLVPAVLAFAVLAIVLLTREGERPEAGVLAARSGVDDAAAAALRDGGAAADDGAAGRATELVRAPAPPDGARQEVTKPAAGRGGEGGPGRDTVAEPIASTTALAGIQGRVRGGKGGLVALVGSLGAPGGLVATDSLLRRRWKPTEEVFAVAPIEDDGEFRFARPAAMPQGAALIAIAPAGTALVPLDERLAQHEIELEWAIELLIRVDPALSDAPIDVYWTPSARSVHPLAEREHAVRNALKCQNPFLVEIANAILWRATAHAGAEELTLHVPFSAAWPPPLATSRTGAVVRNDRGDIVLLPASMDDETQGPRPPTFVIGFPPAADGLSSVRGDVDLFARASRGQPRGNRSPTATLGLVVFAPPPAPSRSEAVTWTLRTPDGASLSTPSLRHDAEGSWTVDETAADDGLRWEREGDALFLAMPFTSRHAEARDGEWVSIRSHVPTPGPVFTTIGEDGGWRELCVLPYSCIGPGGAAAPSRSVALWTLGLRSESILIEHPSGERSTWQRWSIAVHGPRGHDLIADQGEARRYEFLPDLRIAPKSMQTSAPTAASAPTAPRPLRTRAR